MKLNDNTVFVAGGGSGIGLALAVALRERSNSVIVCGKNEAKLEDGSVEVFELIPSLVDTEKNQT